jgi:putative oxidoreductase
MHSLHDGNHAPALPRPAAGRYGVRMNQLLKTDADFAPLMLRLALGAVFFPHGAQKVLGWFGGYGFAGTMGYFTGQMHIPALFAFLAIAAEFAGSLALVAGLFTRVAALGIGATMAVAVATVHWKNGFFMNWSGAQGGEGLSIICSRSPSPLCSCSKAAAYGRSIPSSPTN